MLAPGWGTGTRGGSPPKVKAVSVPVGFWILKVVFTYCVYEIYEELDLISRDQIKSKGERLD